MSTYRQLSLEERCRIPGLHEAGQSYRQIAAALDRQPSTISRELKRNSGTQIGYRPAHAQAQSEARRWNGARLDRDDGLREIILDRLAGGWSPEQIAGRFAHEAGHRVISHETIYRFVYAQLKRTNDRRWRHYLPRAKYKRGWRTKGGWPRRTDRISVHDRPADIATRCQAGHWEADTMLFSTIGHAILVAHERHSRLTIAMPQPSLKADPVAAALTAMLHPLPSNLRRSITFDNGTEFTHHKRIGHQLGAKTYFCDPHAPWQKGGVENAIRRLRRNLPRKTNLGDLPPGSIDAILRVHNNTPRKCLGYPTPAEIFQPLHFECESTPGSSPGRREARQVLLLRHTRPRTRPTLQRCNAPDTLRHDAAPMPQAAPAPEDLMDLATRLLVVDDDPGIRDLTAQFLSGHGYLVDTAADGAEMRAQMARHSYALVVLDVMMPGEDGLTILRALDRATAPAVIILSVIGEEVDKIVGLEMGADDYLAKPANPRELLARIRSVLRRQGSDRPAPAASPRQWLRFAGWRLDPVGRELIDPEDIVINLSDGEFRLLLALVEHPRRVLTRDQLLDLSRGAQADHFDRAIDVQISRLRRKLADDLIRTVRNEGYMFTADVTRA